MATCILARKLELCGARRRPSADGAPAAIDVVVQMLREDGQWKVFRQLWLVNTPPADYQREAIAWLGPADPVR